MQPQSIAIIGAGFSGSLLSLQLLRHCPPATRISLIEQSAVFGTGLAWSTPCAEHLLNVPAGRMSAFADRPRDFLDWLERAGVPADAGSFVSRQHYGRYLQDLLADAIRGCPAGRLERIRGKAVAVSHDPDTLTVHLSGGRATTATIAVVATGNNQPADLLPGLRSLQSYHPDPWAPGVADGLAPDAAVLLIGAGLTMVDIVLRLLQRGHRGPIHAISRRGLLPHAHVRHPVPPQGIRRHELPHQLSDLLHFIRGKAAESGSWHATVDALRPVTQQIWRSASTAERRRFLAHLRPWWDVHRHRMAPAIADRITAARTSGQLVIHAGRITDCREQGNDLAVGWQPRGTSTAQSLRVQRIINCSGPATNVAQSNDPLFQSLLRNGMARPDPLGLGFDTTMDGAFQGNVRDRLFGVGPVCRGALWEITAVPDIRLQCESLAQHIADRVRQQDIATWGRLVAGLEQPALWLR